MDQYSRKVNFLKDGSLIANDRDDFQRAALRNALEWCICCVAFSMGSYLSSGNHPNVYFLYEVQLLKGFIWIGCFDMTLKGLLCSSLQWMSQFRDKLWRKHSGINVSSKEKGSSNPFCQSEKGMPVPTDESEKNPIYWQTKVPVQHGKKIE